MSQGPSLSRPRRRVLAALAGAGIALAALPMMIREVLAAGSLPGGKGIVRLQGDVRVNGKPAAVGQIIRAGDVLETGRDGQAVFVIGEDAFLLRSGSRLELQGDNLLISGLRILTGKLLSVFGKGRRQVVTSTATAGIRGTGLYVEADAQKSYICTCYGEVRLGSIDDPAATEVVRTTHHDQPRYIYAKGAGRAGTALIVKAPVINHTDEELIMLESLVWRSPPFVTSGYESGRY